MQYQKNYLLLSKVSIASIAAKRASCQQKLLIRLIVYFILFYFFSFLDQKLISLLILFFLFFSLGQPIQRSLRLRRFKSDRDEIWQDCSSSHLTHRLTELDFWYDVIISRWRP